MCIFFLIFQSLVCIDVDKGLGRAISKGAIRVLNVTSRDCVLVWAALSSCSYLAGGDELQRPQGAAHVRDVGLELVDGIGNAGLDLAGVGARRRVGGDLVESGGHVGGWLATRMVRSGRFDVAGYKKTPK